MEPITCRTAAELRRVLFQHGDAPIYTVAPPFTGVRVYRQSDGALLLAPISEERTKAA